MAAGAPAGVDQSGDCDDGAADVFPGAEESCGDVDHNCDGVVGDDDLLAVDRQKLFLDGDGDGFGSGLGLWECPGQIGLVARDGDCNDLHPLIHPEQVEICNGGIDDDCSGAADELDSGTVGLLTTFEDLDGDGYGGAEVLACSEIAPAGDDCDDGRDDVNPGVWEWCGSVDHDCDGIVGDDEINSADLVLGFGDEDGDGYGSVAGWFCPDAAFSVLGGDCDDEDAGVHPGALELCNGIDDNCDPNENHSGEADDRFVDGDGDGFGGLALGPGCLVSGEVAVAGDCNDADASVFPGAEELCNDVDDDCDGHRDRAGEPGSDGPLGCDLCPYVDSTPVITKWTVNPCLTNEPSTFGCIPIVDTHEVGTRLHQIYVREDLPEYRDELVVFMPPGYALDLSKVQGWVAGQGYKVITLIRKGIREQYLPGCYDQIPTTCQEILLEVLDGTDTSPDYEIPFDQSIEGELQALIAYLEETDPGRGWGQHLTDTGAVDWSGVHGMAWSSGGGALGILARERALASATGVATPLDYQILGGGQWATAAPELRLLSHDKEFDRFGDEWAALAPFTQLLLDEPFNVHEPWPWATDTSLYYTNVQIPYGCTAHNVIANDECVPDEMRAVYKTLACGLGDPEFSP